ncbi:BPTD_3080 family restriction endonuclease [Flagellimonas sediminis]|uniref:DEAD/DEAH box helicase family protein n=1 Tax=Flagellimonas sediminis TaxID=2696468 RepID=A0A6I5KNP3_9FLAO|nr:DEAD/DEAH box helicase family protein [Allomuricauda sediminis]NDV42063.1 DEAD/DEAH box helicase family protein [Allomuricauda sediminis]
MAGSIDKLIINSPHQEPQQHWFYDRENRNFYIKEGRRPAGYVMATPNSKAFDDPGIFVEIDIVNKIRPRVKAWQEAGYPGVTGITKRLLEHWQDPEERKDRRFFFCQLEAIETLIWLTEAPAADKVGVDIQGDGGAFERWCSKMATGSGKTIIMSMIIAWNFLNKVSNPTDARFSKYALCVAPGLTVKSRLQVLQPTHEENYYEEFNIVPAALMDKLRQGKVIIHNWHALAWDSQDKIDAKVEKGYLRSVDKRQRMEISGEAYVRNVLGEMSTARNIIVLNDEAHHAWRMNPEAVGKYKRTGSDKDSAEEATIWVGGLDKIHEQRGILKCFDLSATPFTPSGKKAAEDALFTWIVSDFGLNDAIESGLVKTPRVVVRDDSERTKELKSRLYHIYADDEVKDDINRKAEETEPLPDLLINAYYLLGKDWLETKNEWESVGHKVPPVMITVANRTETSARIKYAFDHNQILIPELCAPEKTLQIDSRVLESAESETEALELVLDSEDEDGEENIPKLTKKQQAELLRLTVDTVGKEGEPGEQIQNVISVGMLSEGWDAKTVTHIMGLRAFSSQLLCEQVVGRGLRRVSYDVGEDGLFEAEYVNIFGVPFTFLPHEGGEGTPPPPPKPKTKIEPRKEKAQHEISFPNIVRIDHVYYPQLKLDWEKVNVLEIDPYESITEAEMAAIISGKANPKVKSAIGLEQIAEDTRIQSIVFKIASTIYNSEKKPDWKGSKEIFLAQLVRIVEQFIDSDNIKIKNDLFNQDDSKRKILIILNMNKIVQHIWTAIRSENTERLTPVFDKEKPIRSTEDVRTWYTSKPCEWTDKSHISHCVYDSGWEASEAYFFDKSDLVESFVKNDHLGFTILYNHKGVIRKFYPDFILRLVNGDYMVLETKGVDNQQNQTKREYLNEWVNAVNNHGGFGKWHWDVSFHPSDIEGLVKKYLESELTKSHL